MREKDGQVVGARGVERSVGWGGVRERPREWGRQWGGGLGVLGAGRGALGAGSKRGGGEAVQSCPGCWYRRRLGCRNAAKPLSLRKSLLGLL